MKDIKKLSRTAISGKFLVSATAVLISAAVNSLVMSPNTTYLTSMMTGSVASSGAVIFSYISIVASFIISGVLNLGLITFFTRMAEGHELRISHIFDTFKKYAKITALKAHIIARVVMWSVLFIVPGIIAFLKYSMAYYIFLENPGIPAAEILKKSAEVMSGHKLKYFFLILSFTGWFLLGILTLGLGFLWLIPYYKLTSINFYRNIKGSL